MNILFQQKVMRASVAVLIITLKERSRYRGGNIHVFMIYANGGSCLAFPPLSIEYGDFLI